MHREKLMLAQRLRDPHSIKRIAFGMIVFSGLMALVTALPTAKPAAEVPAVVVAAEEAKPERPLVEPGMQQYRLHRGESLVSLLASTGVHEAEVQQAIDEINKVANTKDLGKSVKVAVEIDASTMDPTVPVLSSISLPLSKTTVVQLDRTDAGAFKAKKIEKETVKSLVRLRGTIKGSFYRTAQNMGLSPAVISELVKAYSYDVDFQRDVKAGDKLELVVEQTKTTDGVVVSTGGLQFANLDLGDRKVGIYRFTDAKGRTDYYNAKGESLRKALLRTPINGAQITSGFGMREHPILGYTKMHKGVDFAAATGTPILAAGDGVVKSAGWSNGYGNLVVLKHTEKYDTAYAHASRIAKGIKPGVRVRQGQVVAYVGSTGQSTGPHLHYEVRVNGAQVNPKNIKFKTGTALAGADLNKFKSQIGSVNALLGIKEPAKKTNEKPSKGKTAQATPKKTAASKRG